MGLGLMIQSDQATDHRPASPHARREQLLRDVPVSGRATVLVWHRRIWRCRTVGCPQRTWTQTASLAAARASLTERAKRWVPRRVGAEGESVVAVARGVGTGVDSGDARGR